MIEKDRELTEKMLDKAINQQSAVIKLQFENLFQKLDSIYDEVKKTNGTVREHSRLIQELKESEAAHILKCPQTREIHEINNKITTLEKMEVGRKAVSEFNWKQVTVSVAIAAVLVSIIQLIIK